MKAKTTKRGSRRRSTAKDLTAKKSSGPKGGCQNNLQPAGQALAITDGASNRPRNLITTLSHDV